MTEALFLMHRVELKDKYVKFTNLSISKVPNAPCGVESLLLVIQLLQRELKFLMHRVELKEGIANP